MNPAQKRATYEDLLQVPERFVAEIIEGELTTAPRPSFPHARAVSIISRQLDSFDRGTGGPDGPGGWWILFEPELHLGADILVPDIAGWRRERMPVLEDVPYSELAPDWVCEVVSPSTGRSDRVLKMPIYAREQVRHLWLVDPGLRTLEVYRLEAQRWVVMSTHGGSGMIRAEPFAALEIDLGRWWLEQEGQEDA